MSYSIQGNCVRLTRGDTFSVPVVVTNPDGTPYKMQDGDVIRFKLTTKPGGLVLITKYIGQEMILTLEPSDTSILPCGMYFFDMQMTFAGGAVDTFLVEGTFIISAESDAIELTVYAPDGSA